MAYNFRPESFEVLPKTFGYDDEGEKLLTYGDSIGTLTCFLQRLSGQYNLRRYGFDDSSIVYILICDKTPLTKMQLRNAVYQDSSDNEMYDVYSIERFSEHEEIVLKVRQ